MILLQLFLTFFKIGLFTFGGGYAMLPLIQAEVLEKGWLPLESMVNFIAVSESTPGPFAVNIATYVGMETAGWPGAACATLGVVLPSFLVMLLVARGFAAWKGSRVVRGVMAGLRPAVVGLIAAALVSLAGAVFFPAGLGWERLAGAEFWLSLGIFAVSAVLAFRKAHPILILCLCAAAGMILGAALNLP